jgi:hydroxyquinol 1,2-dioxygenase
VTSLTRHLHSFVRDVQPTEAEWHSAIQFLTETGQCCDDKRQEFILLSDTLGVTMLVDSINHRDDSGSRTDSTILGPFYVARSPDTPMWSNIAQGVAGVPCFISGFVRNSDGNPIEGVQIEVW